MSQIIRLLIADDHPVVRDGLRGIFEASGEFEVAGEAANGREAVDRAAALHPDVVLMDLRMPPPRWRPGSSGACCPARELPLVRTANVNQVGEVP